MQIGIIGLGLIGGSYARAISARTSHTVFAADTDSATMQAALAESATSAALVDDIYPKLELLIVALTPGCAIDAIRHAAGLMPPGAIIMDICGTKRRVVSAAVDAVEGTGVVYVGGHPMAGREVSGFANSLETMFDGASMILTPPDSTPAYALATLEALFAEIGFARTVITTPEEHDRIIAFTSQLAHVVSASYVKSPAAERFMGFSAGSYRDLTRVARLNPPMWTELFIENRENLVAEIDEIVKHLGEYRAAIATQDATTLERLLAESTRRKERLDANAARARQISAADKPR